MSKDDLSPKNNYQLHTERLATTSNDGSRVYLYPEDVNGKWKKRRDFFYSFLILMYLLLPWINISGHQSILLNISTRTFIFFGKIFHANDAPLLIFPLIGFVFFIGFITSLFGRLWCGWACPQTVFIQTIYQRIERLIEGKARARRKLDNSPLSFNKIIKKCLKWFLFLLVSLHITHSFLGYFVGARKLFFITTHMPTNHMTLFVTMLTMTLIILLDFGWFREQFCIIACPYGRIQSVMMDDNSLIIAYDKKRGEPRRSNNVERENEGDCIDCFHCVKVCPTGIDIRRGTQMECIACTNCIDACDEIMHKTGKPAGLLSYNSENGLNNKKVSMFRFRSILYLSILISIILAFIISLKKVSHIKIAYLRGSGAPFSIVANDISKTQIADKKLILNYLKVTFEHVTSNPQIRFKQKHPNNKIKLITPTTPLYIKREHQIANLFIKFSKSILTKGSHTLVIDIINQHGTILSSEKVTLIGPIK